MTNVDVCRPTVDCNTETGVLGASSSDYHFLFCVFTVVLSSVVSEKHTHTHTGCIGLDVNIVELGFRLMCLDIGLGAFKRHDCECSRLIVVVLIMTQSAFLNVALDRTP